MNTAHISAPRLEPVPSRAENATNLIRSAELRVELRALGNFLIDELDLEGLSRAYTGWLIRTHEAVQLQRELRLCLDLPDDQLLVALVDALGRAYDEQLHLDDPEAA
jgi:hypothetical protein